MNSSSSQAFCPTNTRTGDGESLTGSPPWRRGRGWEESSGDGVCEGRGGEHRSQALPALLLTVYGQEPTNLFRKATKQLQVIRRQATGGAKSRPVGNETDPETPMLVAASEIHVARHYVFTSY